MAEKKRWIAMYTKHLTQKRKVYHDGFLDLHFSRKKVLLYDEADNLLESRMLKANELVNSGERLTFQAYLVDICEPMDESKPSSQPSSDHSKVQHRKPFKKSSPYSEEIKTNLANNFASKDLTPSRKMIRGFKKRELHKFAGSVKPTFEGTLPLGSANNGSNDHPLINSPCDGKSGAGLSHRENDEFSKDVPPHKPLRDVNQILSILQRPNATSTCSDISPKTLMSLTKVPPESDTSKRIKVEPMSPRAASRVSLPQQQFMLREISPAKTTARTMTHLNSASPSFDLGI